MRNKFLSRLWALVGGFTAAVLCCWLGALLLTAIMYFFGGKVTPVELDDVNCVAILAGILAGIWCKRLFYRAKLPGYKPED
jgi:hypothetical protein